MEAKSTASTHNANSQWWWWFIPIAAAVSLGGYLYASYSTYAIGFPLDDAWIHQTYARSLANGLGWVYGQGQPSGGSTSPMWTMILSGGYRLGIPYLAWTFGVEWILLASVGLAAEFGLRKNSGYAQVFPFFGIGLVFEWHLVWASASGMEIVLAAIITLAILFMPKDKNGAWIITGGLLGAAVWVRPDLVTIAAPVGMVWLLSGGSRRTKILRAGLFLVGFTLVAVPYFLWMHNLTGSFWPNTLYAKQTEYAILINSPLFLRFINELKQTNLGAGLVLLPGFLSAFLFSLRDRKWNIVMAGIWWLGFALLYAVQLPVTYQYGRYMMPAMPVYFLIGCWGWIELFRRLKDKQRRLLRFGFSLLIAPVLAGFYFIGARSYANDVAVIQTNMVEPAIWLSENTAEDDLIAVHDIGAVGYFSGRRIVDLAGLVTPELIPIIRDEDQLSEYLDNAGVDYLMTFPNWYLILGKDKPVVYEASEIFTLPVGQPAMVIYRWQ